MSDFLFDAESEPSPLVAARARVARAHNAVARVYEGEAVPAALTREVKDSELALVEIERAELEKRK